MIAGLRTQKEGESQRRRLGADTVCTITRIGKGGGVLRTEAKGKTPRKEKTKHREGKSPSLYERFRVTQLYSDAEY